jgi:histidine kinase
MATLLQSFRHSLIVKLIATVGSVLICSMAVWAYFSVAYQKEKVMANIVAGSDRLSNTVRLGTHYAMMLNSRDDITQIIGNIGRQKEIANIRIYNKQGAIKYSNRREEIDRITNIEAEACFICHRSVPPQEAVELEQRVRVFRSPQGYRLLGIITPIGNDAGCSAGQCHFHPADKKILGAIDMVVSLEETDREIVVAQKGLIGLTALVFVLTSSSILLFLLRFVNRPIQRLIGGTRLIADGVFDARIALEQEDEMGQLAAAIQQMGRAIGAQQAELNKQRQEYQNLFERVPCLITVQDRDYRLLRFNHEFALRFAPRVGDACYAAYKGRTAKCPACPVERTFADGQMHSAEESGINKDGTPSHWIVRSSPILDGSGRIVAAMEISLDITERRQLEVELQQSEKKYHDIFNHIPNPVFVLDADSLAIVDCNHSVQAVYGFAADALTGTDFMALFPEEERTACGPKIRSAALLNQVRHCHRSGRQIYVNIRVSPSESAGRRVLLVTTSDITQRLEAEQQLIQASKMATVGEMATGVAHELNQPLSVIKTATSFFIRKLAAGEPVDPEQLAAMLPKMDRNVDRAARIIQHMRQFARKSELELERVQINDVLQSAFEIFSQQLKVRGIAVVRRLSPDLPRINADPQRLEQVFINLLLNARDAIEERWRREPEAPRDGRITIETALQHQRVICRIADTGVGIRPGMSEKIFEPFFTTKEVGQGTGLGLSISYGIVKECGGEIRAESGVGQGASFVMHFPPAAAATTP